MKQCEMKYSVIIPAYNAEATIRRCLDSLVTQMREDVQIIVIDDGSTDATGQILAEYSGIERVTQENRGVSAARNRGLELASGKYVVFADSDDYVRPGYFAALDSMAEDCSLCFFRREIAGGPQLNDEALFLRINDSDTWLRKMRLLLESREIMQLYNKRFSREIIARAGLRFAENLYSTEDFNFCLAYAMQAGDIRMYLQTLYVNDLSNQQSLSRKPRADLADQLAQGFRYAADSVRLSGHSAEEKRVLLTELDYQYAKCACSCVAETFRFGKSGFLKNRREYRAICERFREPLNGRGYRNAIHRGLRFFLAHRLAYPVYLVTWLVKRPRRESSGSLTNTG